MIGIRRRAASRTAISSVFRSVTKTASGRRSMSRTPPRLNSSLASSACIPIRSLVGSSSSLPSSCQLGQLVQAGDPRRDRVEVGQQAAEPALVDVGHLAAVGPFLDRAARLLLGADEEHRAAAAGELAGEAARVLQQRLGLDEVDDVDPVQLAEDVAAHVRVPAPGLVAEVDSGLQQLFEACLWHG